MPQNQRKYDHEYKVQAVKLAKEIGGGKAAKELGVPEGTIHTWLKAARCGTLDIGEGSHTPASAMSLAEELASLRKRVKEQDKEIRRIKEENEFLEEASAFFAASRRKSAKTRE
ncbi:MAG: transposase [Hungatella sp.]